MQKTKCFRQLYRRVIDLSVVSGSTMLRAIQRRFRTVWPTPPKGTVVLRCSFAVFFPWWRSVVVGLAIASFGAKTAQSAHSRLEERVPALHLNRLLCVAHLVPMIQFLGAGAVQTQAEPAEHFTALLAHRASSAVVDRHKERHLAKLEQGHLRWTTSLVTIRVENKISCL